MTFEDEVTADSPELWWDTRDAVGTAQPDASGNGHTGTISGSPTLGADGLVFAGGQLITSDDQPFPTGELNPFAIEAVVKDLTFDDANGMVCDLESLGGDYLALYAPSSATDHFEGQYLDSPSYGEVTAAGGTTVASTSTLTHVLAEYDGTTFSLYLNGVLDGSVLAASGVEITDALFFCGGDAFGDFITATIQHAVLYDHDLGPTRVAAHFAALEGGGGGGGGGSDYPTLALAADFLGGTEDLSPYGREGASVARGTTAPSITGYVSDAGTYSTVLDNIDRTFDPNNLSGPFVTAGETDVVPGVPVRAIINWDSVDHPIFAGTADGWPQSYPLHGQDQLIDFRATDAFAFFAGASAEITRPAEKTGARIAAVLTALGYPGVTDIAPGKSFVPALNRGTAVSLSHLADVAQTEWGELYVAGDLDGTFTFRGRDEIATDTRSSVSQAAFVQHDPDNPYDGLQFSDLTMGSPPIVNEVVISYSDTGKQITLRDDASVAMPWSNGVPKSLPISLPMMTGSQARSYARWLLLLYAYPITTFTSITLTPANAPGATFDLWEQALTRELGDRITVVVDPLHLSATPPNRPELSGDPITRDCVIRGIQHDFAQQPYSTTFYLQDQTWMDNLFIMDTSELDGPDIMGM